MSLKLHMHPLASYCHKVLIALYENGIVFEPVMVDFGNEASRKAFFAVAPLGKMPALEDTGTRQVTTESSIIIEYLSINHPGPSQLLPTDAAAALPVRTLDRFFDTYIHTPMQQIVGDKLRPEDKRDPHGVEANRAQLEKSYALIDAQIAGKQWACGDDYTMADCAASPALFYAEKLVPFDRHRHLSAYFTRLLARPSYVRVLDEAAPYMAAFPG